MTEKKVKKADKRMEHKMTQEQVVRYLELVEKRLYILTHSGVDWIPEYERELADIDKEIAELRKVIDAEFESEEASDLTEDGNKRVIVNSKMLMAVNKAKNYDYQAFYDRWETMTPIDIMKECKNILDIYDTLQQTPEPLGLEGLESDGFMETMIFLESFCMRYLVDIFFEA